MLRSLLITISTTEPGSHFNPVPVFESSIFNTGFPTLFMFYTD